MFCFSFVSVLHVKQNAPENCPSKRRSKIVLLCITCLWKSKFRSNFGYVESWLRKLLATS